jgi:hypothetical protein
MVAIANSPDPVATASQFLKSGEPHVRSATATAIREIIRGVEAGPWISPLNGLLASNEQAGAEANPKEIAWSCRKCGYHNGRDAPSCAKMRRQTADPHFHDQRRPRSR